MFMVRSVLLMGWLWIVALTAHVAFAQGRLCGNVNAREITPETPIAIIQRTIGYVVSPIPKLNVGGHEFFMQSVCLSDDETLRTREPVEYCLAWEPSLQHNDIWGRSRICVEAAYDYIYGPRKLVNLKGIEMVQPLQASVTVWAVDSNQDGQRDREECFQIHLRVPPCED